jgi:tRNA pseudouridine13 synthase
VTRNIQPSLLAYVSERPPTSGVIRRTADDFQVDEDLGFEPAGKGEHILLHVRKRHLNTEAVARQLAKLAGVKLMDVGYAGLKDRMATTCQWFSVNLAGKPEPDWTALVCDDLQFLTIARHDRKLRRGALQGNHFKLMVRDIQGDPADIAQRLTRVAQQGVPNYFGDQRFGHANLERATAMFEGRLQVKDRHQRSMYLSSVRSELFNRVLSHRVAAGHWNRAIEGDIMMLNGTHSIFPITQIDSEIEQRIIQNDIHPTGPLWGRGELRTALLARHLEESILQEHSLWRQGLEQADMDQQRRSLRLNVTDLQWNFMEPQVLYVQFGLPPGSYATMVLREVVVCEGNH